MMRKLRRGLPSAVAAAAAFGAMMLVRREWTAQVGLFVYFSLLVLLTDGIDIRFFWPKSVETDLA
jgi:hypothetical protein